MPTSAATARAVVSLSPVSSTGRSPSALQRRDRLGGGRLDRVGDDEARRGPRRPSAAMTAVRPCGSAARLRGVERGRDRQAPVGQQRGPADQRRAWPSTMPSTPRPSRLVKPSTAGSAPELVARGARRSPGRSGARRRPRARRRGAAPRRASTPSAASTSTQRHPAGGDRAGLVEHDRVDPARGLEDLRALDQQPELRAAAGADQQRGRRGEPERARAGDDQHRDGGGEGERRALAGAEPEAERRDGERDDDRDEDAGDAVGEPLDRRLAGLRVGRRAGRSARARCRRRPAWRARRAGRRR